MKRVNLLLMSVALTGLAQARPHHPPPPPPAQVVTRLGDALTLSQERGWHKDVVLDEQTSFYEGRQPDASVREKLAPGDFVMIRDELSADGRYHVQELHRHQGRPVHGRVLSVNSAGFLLESHGEPVQVDVRDSTQYGFGWLPGARAQVQTGGHVMVEAKQVGANHVEAAEVNIPFPWMQLAAGLGLSGLVAGLVVRRRRQARRSE